MDDLRIRFQGFTPSEFTRAYFNEVLQRLHEEAPALSFLKADISRERDKYRIVLQINSSVGHFVATACSDKITSLGQEVAHKMHRQLDRWKAQRRSRETIRDPRWWQSLADKESTNGTKVG